MWNHIYEQQQKVISFKLILHFRVHINFQRHAMGRCIWYWLGNELSHAVCITEIVVLMFNRVDLDKTVPNWLKINLKTHLILWTCFDDKSFPQMMNDMPPWWLWLLWINTLRIRQNGCHYTNATFKCIFLNENVWIRIKISLKFVPKGPINNIPALV